MAKKVVATLKTKGEKNYAKVISAVKNEKTGGYSFKEMIVTADHVRDAIIKEHEG
jgi:hypothetical protein